MRRHGPVHDLEVDLAAGREGVLHRALELGVRGKHFHPRLGRGLGTGFEHSQTFVVVPLSPRGERRP